MDLETLARSVLPDLLRAPALAQWSRVRWRWGEVDGSVELFDVDASDGDVAVHRQLWWFDLDARAWALESHDIWYMDPDDAMFLADRLAGVARPGTIARRMG